MFKGTGTLERRVETRPLPLDRVVKWLPRDDAFYLLAAVLTSASAEPLVVTRETLLQVERHLREPECASGCGVLLGARCVCPKTRMQYVLVEGAIRAVMAITEQEPPATTVARLRALVADVERRGKQQVVGWYRGGAVTVPRASARDMAVHRELFADPWRVALLRDGAGTVRSGAFMRVEPVEERAYLVPFHEMLPRAKRRDRETKHTAVAWANYRCEVEVAPLAEVAAVARGGGGTPVAHAVDPVAQVGSVRMGLDPDFRWDDGREVTPAPLPSGPAPPLTIPAPALAGAAPALGITASPAATPTETVIQKPAHTSEECCSPAPREQEPVPESIAPAPPEPLEFIWVPPRAPAGGSAKATPWRALLWAAAAAIVLAGLVVLWRVISR